MSRPIDSEINLIRRDNVNKLREKSGLNKKLFGEKCGIGGSTISNMLIGRQGISEKTVEAIYRTHPELEVGALDIDNRGKTTEEVEEENFAMTESEFCSVTFNLRRPVAINMPLNEARALLISLLGD